MINIIDINQRIDFTSKADTSEPKNVFVLRALSGVEMMNYGDLNDKDNLFKFLDASITEVKNISMSKQDFIKALPLDVLTELIIFTTNINNLTPDDKKKL
jgi:hypothetical protein